MRRVIQDYAGSVGRCPVRAPVWSQALRSIGGLSNIRLLAGCICVHTVTARHLGVLLERRDVHIDFAVIVTDAPMSTTGNFIYRGRQNPNIPNFEYSANRSVVHLPMMRRISLAIPPCTSTPFRRPESCSPFVEFNAQQIRVTLKHPVYGSLRSNRRFMTSFECGARLSALVRLNLSTEPCRPRHRTDAQGRATADGRYLPAAQPAGKSPVPVCTTIQR